jgi:hypothetical protein
MVSFRLERVDERAVAAARRHLRPDEQVPLMAPAIQALVPVPAAGHVVPGTALEKTPYVDVAEISQRRADEQRRQQQGKSCGEPCAAAKAGHPHVWTDRAR